MSSALFYEWWGNQGELGCLVSVIKFVDIFLITVFFVVQILQSTKQLSIIIYVCRFAGLFVGWVVVVVSLLFIFLFIKSQITDRKADCKAGRTETLTHTSCERLIVKSGKQVFSICWAMLMMISQPNCADMRQQSRVVDK